VTSDPEFKVTTFCVVEYQKNLKDKVTIAQEESIPNIWNGAICLVSLIDL